MERDNPSNIPIKAEPSASTTVTGEKRSMASRAAALACVAFAAFGGILYGYGLKYRVSVQLTL